MRFAEASRSQQHRRPETNPVAVHLQGYTHCCRVAESPLPADPPVSPQSPQARAGLPIIIVFPAGLIEISTVDRGVISLRGVRSELYVAMNGRGRLYGTVRACVHAVTFLRRLPAVRDAVETDPLVERRVRNRMMMQRFESHHTDGKQKAMPRGGQPRT